MFHTFIARNYSYFFIVQLRRARFKSRPFNITKHLLEEIRTKAVSRQHYKTQSSVHSVSYFFDSCRFKLILIILSVDSKIRLLSNVVVNVLVILRSFNVISLWSIYKFENARRLLYTFNKNSKILKHDFEII